MQRLYGVARTGVASEIVFKIIILIVICIFIFLLYVQSGAKKALNLFLLVYTLCTANGMSVFYQSPPKSVMMS
jgi:hypothetical protein